MEMMDIDAIMAQMRPRLDTHGLNTKAIRAHLGDCPWRVYLFGEVDSTNTMLKKLCREGTPAGTVLVADRQTGGRGRLGRSFQSPGGVGVYLSALLRPDCTPQELMHLTCATAVAMCDAVENAFGFRPGIKWTNDLVVSKRKLGGILTELVLDPKTCRVEGAVIGIGINCNQLEADFDESIRPIATSARMVMGREADRNRLIAEMVKSLEAMDQTLLSFPSPMLGQYRKDCITLGQHVSILRGDEVRHADAIDIDAEGGLTVRYENGEIGTVTSGEVSIRGLYGYI
ncbi:MAG: biotin--[Oscillospiraceae bacterium]|nr:biotin--[acetyl-CoA-carboxylase] ligase [Oscillospiraceae bacterium]